MFWCIIHGVLGWLYVLYRMVALAGAFMMGGWVGVRLAGGTMALVGGTIGIVFGAFFMIDRIRGVEK
ncbi:MAG: hypothetical protein PHX05_00015 [Acidobacteriota bacterium]|nr:hypothetical protein [Acidobacteriota bacterium]